MTFEEQIAHASSRLKKKPVPAQEAPVVQPPTEIPAVEELSLEEIKEEAIAFDNSRFQDSFRSDASFMDASLIEEAKDTVDDNLNRMTVIPEDDDESRTTVSLLDSASASEVKLPQFKQPPL